MCGLFVCVCVLLKAPIVTSRAQKELCPSMSQDGPKTAPDGFNMSPGRVTTAPGSLKTAPRWPRTAPPKRAFGQAALPQVIHISLYVPTCLASLQRSKPGREKR